MKIIYKEDGKIDIEKSIAGEIEKLNEIDKENERDRQEVKKLEDLLEETEKSDMPKITEKFISFVEKISESNSNGEYNKQNRYAVGYYSSYVKNDEKLHLLKDMDWQLRLTDLDKYIKNGEVSYDCKVDVTEVIRLLIKMNYGEAYITRIVDKDDNTIYLNKLNPHKKPIEFYNTQIKDWGKVACSYCLEKLISEKKYQLAFMNPVVSQGKEMLKDVVGLIETSLACVYPQRKEELIEYLLNNATEPDLSEDEFDVQTTYKVAVQSLQMIKNKDSAVQVCEFIAKAKEKRCLINDFDIYSFLAKFGKETGIQVFEEKVIKPAEKRNGKVGYSDYHVCNVDKAKAVAEKYRQENKQFETKLAGKELTD